MATWAGLTVYVLLLEIEFSRGKGWDHINRFNPTTFFVPVPSQDLDFKCHMSWSFFLCSLSSGWKVIVPFVDIGGIDDHHCLNFLFIILFGDQYVDRVKHHYLKLTSYFLRELKINIWTVYKLHSGIYPW